MKRTFACILLFLLVSGTAMAAVVATASPAPPAPEGSSELNFTRRPVTFSHESHFQGMGVTAKPEESCTACHHPVGGKVAYITCASKGCHDNLNQKDTSVRSYFLAMHKKEDPLHASCVSCHDKAAAGDPAREKALTGCRNSVCHP